MDVDDKEEMEMEMAVDETEIKPNDKLPWVEKYRPARFDEIISQKSILSTISNFLEGSKNGLPHLLFYGPPGTGKTTTALAIAQNLYGTSYRKHCLELNASDDRGIDIVRNNVKTFATTRQLFESKNQFKFIILDEADAMTSPAQAALRRVMEKYTQTARFCLICNYSSRIIPAIKSRCTRFRFSPLEPEDVVRRLQTICENEGLSVGTAGLDAVVALGEGDMRRCINILQSTYQSFGDVEEAHVYTCCGVATPAENKIMIDSLLQDGFTECYNKILKLKELKGYSLTDIVKDMHKSVLLIGLNESVMTRIVSQLAEIEYRLAAGASEKVQLPSLIAAFQIGRAEISQ